MRESRKGCQESLPLTHFTASPVVLCRFLESSSVGIILLNVCQSVPAKREGWRERSNGGVSEGGKEGGRAKVLTGKRKCRRG
jgi:hypothetical protein